MSGGVAQANAPPAPGAWNAFGNKIDACRFKRADELGQGIDIAAHDAIARFHPLDRGEGQTRQPSQSALIERNQRPRRPQLSSSYHA